MRVPKPRRRARRAAGHVGLAFAAWLAAPGPCLAAKAPPTEAGPPVITLPEEKPAAEPHAPPAPGALDTLVVTAQRREQLQQEVPLSLDVLRGTDLAQRGIQSPLDLPQSSPGLIYDSMVGFSIVYLRGVGTDQFLPSGDVSVTTYIDGIYTPFAHALAQQFGRLDRIEVLKGPQGTLFGRNSTGGAINLITAPPPHRAESRLAVATGRLDTRSLRASLGGPLTDTLRAEVSLLHDERDSYYRRPGNSPRPDFPRERDSGLRLRAKWDLLERLNLDLGALITRQDGVGSAAVSSEDVKPAFAALVAESPGRHQSDPDVGPHLKADNALGYGTLHWLAPWLDVKLSASHQAVTTDTLFDFESSPAPLVTFNPYDMGARITTAELQLLSNTWTPLSDTLDWMAGYYFFDTRDAGFRDVEFTLARSLTNATLAAPLTALDQLLGRADPSLGLPDGVALHLDGLVDTRSHALYGHLNWQLAASWDLTLGARYLDESRHLTHSTIALQYANNISSPPLREFDPRRRRDRALTPKVTLSFAPDPRLRLFATWARGFKSGTFNVLNLMKPPDEVEDESVSSFEIGLKGRLAPGALSYQVAAFSNTIHDLQVLILSLQSSGAVTLENAARTRIRGVDFDLRWRPWGHRLPGLTLRAAGAWLDGHYLAYPDGSGFDQQTGRFRSDMDFTGHRSVRTPRWTALLDLSHRQAAPGGAVTASLGLYYNDGYDFDAQNVTRQNAYSTVNAQLAYRFRPWNLEFSLVGRNLGDTLYYINKFQTDFNTVGAQAPPRSLQLWLRWEPGRRAP